MLFDIYLYILILDILNIYMYILNITYQIDTCILDSNNIHHILFKLFDIYYIYYLMLYHLVCVYIYKY